MFQHVLTRPRYLAAALAILGASLVGASPASAWTDFRGGGWVSNFSGCDAHGWGNRPHALLARYVPGEIDGNGGVSQLSLVHATGANNYRVNGPFTGSFSRGPGHAIWSGLHAFDPRPSVRMLSRSPDVVAADTETIRLRVRIRNFNGLQGCQADVGVTLRRAS